MPSVAVVLGAGGVLGSAFHAGVLAALADVCDWDARGSDLVVGTSAGANTAASIRAGLSPQDHLARQTGAPLSEEGQRLATRVVTPLELPEPPDARRRPHSWGMVARGVVGGRPVVSLAGALPRGTVPTDSIAARVNELHGSEWPRRATWVCTVRVAGARRTVFGRDDVAVDDFGRAVAASSAIPGYFEPVVIDGEAHVDGGIHSTTNLDLVAHLGFDVVVVSAPMAAGHADDAGWRRDNLSRAWHTRSLTREASLLPRRVASISIAPDPDLVAVLGDDNMDPAQAATVATMAYEQTRAELAGPDADRVRRRLEASGTDTGDTEGDEDDEGTVDNGDEAGTDGNWDNA